MSAPTLSKIRALIASLDGPECGAPWQFRMRGHSTLDYTCDLPSGHVGKHGHDQDRGSPWVVACQVVLAALDATVPS